MSGIAGGRAASAAVLRSIDDDERLIAHPPDAIQLVLAYFLAAATAAAQALAWIEALGHRRFAQRRAQPADD